MAVLKCKMCGGELEFTPGTLIAECEYCGMRQTLPKAKDEAVQNLYNRANNLRLKCEFDKAERLYEKILQEDDTDAEAHWGLVLCKYGIEYVEDPKTMKRIPTCHRTSYDPVIIDGEYLAAVKYAEISQRSIYEAEAKQIDQIQKNILDIVKNEKPFDVFLCYKETDEEGRRTPDSAVANDIYYQLTQEGLKVFYAAITLEDKLGQAYEPYIFAALNSSKVMLVIGTKPHYFTSVWVKNEWSRFMKLMKTDRSKLLIPCYRDMDAYELPEEFAHLQAQDMSKIGFINDVVRGIRKVVAPQQTAAAPQEAVVVNNAAPANVTALLDRVFLSLEDGEFDRADEFCEQVLNLDAKNAQAYLGKLMAQLKRKMPAELESCPLPFDANANYQKIMRFGDEKLKAELAGYIESIVIRNKEAIYQQGCQAMKMDQYELAISSFEQICGYRDTEELISRIRLQKMENIYFQACKAMELKTEERLNEAISLFEHIAGYKDGEQRIEECRKELDIIDKERKYQQAHQILKSSKVDSTAGEKAASIFAQLGDYKDAAELAQTSPMEGKYIRANVLLRQAETNYQYDNIAKSFRQISGYKDADELAKHCEDTAAELLAIEEKAARKFRIGIIVVMTCLVLAIGLIVLFSNFIIPNSKYNTAMDYMEAGKYDEAIDIFRELSGYKNSAEMIYVAQELKVEASLKNAKVGQFVKFGSFEQDNDSSNGQEAIEWLVLRVEDGKALLLSRYALDAKQFNDYKITNITWENSTLRDYLNNRFWHNAFSATEMSYVLNSGTATHDPVFLLSIEEAKQFMDMENFVSCTPTEYAAALGVYTGEAEIECCWWLRTPGDISFNMSYFYDGGYYTYGAVCDQLGAVRPAIWVTLPQ